MGDSDSEPQSRRRRGACISISCVTSLLLLGAVLLIAAYGAVLPVRVTLEDAALTRLALAGANGTDLAVTLSVTVAVTNPNWAVSAVYTDVPLTADLRLRLRTSSADHHQLLLLRRGVRLVDAGRWVPPHKTGRSSHVVVSTEVSLGSEALREIVKEMVAGEEVSMELKVAGKVLFRPVHAGKWRVNATCPIKLHRPGSTTHAHTRVIECH